MVSWATSAMCPGWIVLVRLLRTTTQHEICYLPYDVEWSEVGVQPHLGKYSSEQLVWIVLEDSLFYIEKYMPNHISTSFCLKN